VLPWGQEKAGGALIGQLERPEVVTDESQWPKTFNEEPGGVPLCDGQFE